MSLGRVCRITVFRQPTEDEAFFEEEGSTIEVTDLRVQFTIEKSLTADPNTCEITINNLAEKSRTEFQQRPLRVHVEAGYESDSGPRLLFVGDVRPGSGSRYNGTTWETKLLLGDGSRAFGNGRINRSYKSGTPAKLILRDIAKSLDLDLPPEVLNAPELQSGIAVGEVVTGWSSDELARLIAPYGYTYSIQNGRLQILKDEQVRPEIFVFEESAGMLGVPERGVPDKKGKLSPIKVRHQLYPEILPGSTIEIRSIALSGRYKVQKVRHTGDNLGMGPWETEVEAKPV